MTVQRTLTINTQATMGNDDQEQHFDLDGPETTPEEHESVADNGSGGKFSVLEEMYECETKDSLMARHCLHGTTSNAEDQFNFDRQEEVAGILKLGHSEKDSHVDELEADGSTREVGRYGEGDNELEADESNGMHMYEHGKEKKDEEEEEQNEEDSEQEEDEEGDEDEEEEDPDSHPLYTTLSTSKRIGLRQIWEDATLILVPPRRSVPSFHLLRDFPEICLDKNLSILPTQEKEEKKQAFEFVRGGKGVDGEIAGRMPSSNVNNSETESTCLENYIGLHAFKLQKGRYSDTWISISRDTHGRRVSLQLEPARGLAHLDWISIDSEAMEDNSSLKFKGEAFDPLEAINQTSELSVFPEAEISPRQSTESEASKDILLENSYLHSEFVSTPVQGSSRGKFDISSLPSKEPRVEEPTESRALQIASETTVYRRPRNIVAASFEQPPGIGSPVIPTKAPRSAFRTPRWLRRGQSENSTLEKPADHMRKEQKAVKEPVLERVRVIALDGEILPDWCVLSNDSRKTPKDVRPRKIIRYTGMSANSLGRSGIDISSSSLSRLDGGESSQGADPGELRRTNSMTSARSFRSALSGSSGLGVPFNNNADRDFLSDLIFFLDPPEHYSEVAHVFSSVFSSMYSRVKEFEDSFVYAKGFELHTVQRIRKGILDICMNLLQQQLRESGDFGVRLVAEEHAGFLQLLETLIMGLLYQKLYINSILPAYLSYEKHLDLILTTYRSKKISPAALGVDLCDLGNGDALQEAVCVMTKLERNINGPAQSISPEIIWLFEPSHDGVGATAEMIQDSLLRARTPLGCMHILRHTIEEIITLVRAIEPGLRVAPDDLIPLMAWVIVQSGIQHLESLLFYMKTFRFTEQLAPEIDWSFVTFQAAIAFISDDPLRARAISSAEDVPLQLSGSSARIRPSNLSSTLQARRISASSHLTYAGAATGHLLDPSSSNSQTISSSGGFHIRPTRENILSLGNTSSKGPKSSPLLDRKLNGSQYGIQTSRLASNMRASSALAPDSRLSPPTEKSSRPDASRTTSAEEMPPPSWTTKNRMKERRSSLGESLFPETREKKNRPVGTSTSSSLEITKSQPFLQDYTSPEVLGSIQSVPFMDTPTVQEVSTRQVAHGSDSRSNLRAQSMYRSKSEDASASCGIPWAGSPKSPASVMNRSSPEDSQSIRQDPRLSPQANALEVTRSYTDFSSSENPSWWNWGRDLLGNSSQTASEQQDFAVFESVRTRRHSTSAIETPCRDYIDPAEPFSTPSARLAAILAARTTPISRCRSVISISSASSLESDVPLSPLKAASSRRRRRSVALRQLPTSNLSSKPLTPRLDDFSVLSVQAADFKEPTHLDCMTLSMESQPYTSNLKLTRTLSSSNTSRRLSYFEQFTNSANIS